MSSSIWIKPSGVELEVDDGSAYVAANLGWKRKAKPEVQASVITQEPKRKGRPRIQK